MDLPRPRPHTSNCLQSQLWIEYRPFEVKDLCEPPPQELLDELRWREEMAESTARIYTGRYIIIQ